MFLIESIGFKRKSVCVCRTSENCKSLVLQDRGNIEIFLASVKIWVLMNICGICRLTAEDSTIGQITK